MIQIVNIADLLDPDDAAGRTYRQVNAAKTHKNAVGSLVEIESGVRMFVAKQTRDCDQTPLYSLCASVEDIDNESMFGWNHGYSEDGMTLIQPPAQERKE